MANTSIVTKNEDVVISTTSDLKNTFITIGDKTIPLATYEKTKLIIEEHLAFIDKIKNGFTGKTQKDEGIESRAILVGEYVNKGSTYDLWVFPSIYGPVQRDTLRSSIKDKSGHLPYGLEITGCIQKLLAFSNDITPHTLSYDKFYWTNQEKAINSLGDGCLKDSAHPYFLVKRIYKP